MPIRNYTSTVSASKSMGELQRLLAENKAQKIMIEYDQNGEPTSISFIMLVKQRPVMFRLTVNIEGLLRAMKADKKIPSRSCNMEQARRTAWKNKYDWLHAQLAEIATEQAKIEQLLLGYAVAKNGETLFEALDSNEGFLQIEG